MNKIKIIFLFLIAGTFFFARDLTSDDEVKVNKNKNYTFISENILDISIEPGAAFYVGDFYRHLVNSGAYTVTPSLDIYISVYLLKYFGITGILGSSCIIHPRSYPIEGTIFYMGIELFGQYDFKRLYLKIFSGAGFQHTTMLIQYYASAFFEAGFGLGVKITDYLYIFSSFKYRMGFLHSILLYQMYNLDKNDTLASVSISSGIAVRIKKQNK